MIVFGKLFGKGRPHHGQCGHGKQRDRCCIHPLSDFASGVDVLVCSNPDRKTVEMGFFSGARVHILHNQSGESNLVIAVGDSRYTVPRETAQKIMVR
jgi:Fe2+ transport system protein FeoA